MSKQTVHYSTHIWNVDVIIIHAANRLLKGGVVDIIQANYCGLARLATLGLLILP